MSAFRGNSRNPVLYQSITSHDPDDSDFTDHLDGSVEHGKSKRCGGGLQVRYQFVRGQARIGTSPSKAFIDAFVTVPDGLLRAFTLYQWSNRLLEELVVVRNLRWSRLSEQIFRVAKWSLCRD